MILSTTFKK